jgi:hypothetical protein
LDPVLDPVVEPRLDPVRYLSIHLSIYLSIYLLIYTPIYLLNFMKAALLSAALRVFSVAPLSTGVPSTSRHMPCTHKEQRGQAVQHCKHNLNCPQGIMKRTVMDVESGRAALDIFVHAET